MNDYIIIAIEQLRVSLKFAGEITTFISTSSVPLFGHGLENTTHIVCTKISISYFRFSIFLRIYVQNNIQTKSQLDKNVNVDGHNYIFFQSHETEITQGSDYF